MNLDRIPFREVLEHLAELSDEAGVEMILVGATARDIALVAENQDAALRATNDVDVAVAVQDAEAFMRLTSASPSPSDPHCVSSSAASGPCSSPRSPRRQP